MLNKEETTHLLQKVNRLENIVEEKTQESKFYFRVIDEYVPTLKTDLSFKIKDASEAYCKLSGYKKEEIVDVSKIDLLHPNIPKKVFQEIQDIIEEEGAWEGELKFNGNFEKPYWLHVTFTPMKNEDNSTISYGIIGKDITDKKRIEKISVTDKLTGVLNRHKLDEILSIEIEKAQRYKSVFSVMLVDLDLFKEVNDAYGHEIGDIVLKETAEVIKQTVRHVDVIGRWGGEEFFLILPLIEKESALKTAERIRENISKHTYKVIDHKTCSIGVSTYVSNDTKDTLIKRADEALYVAKKKGRDSICFGVIKST